MWNMGVHYSSYCRCGCEDLKSVRIYYFSITGNTQFISERLKELLLLEGKDTRSIKVNRRNIMELEEADLYIFAFPVFAWREPVSFRKFLNNIRPVMGKKAIIVSTFGGIRGNSEWWVARILKKKGFEVLGYAGVRAEDSHPVLRRPWTMRFIKRGSPGDEDVKKLKEKIEKIIKEGNKIRYKILYFPLDIIGYFYRPPFIDMWFKKYVDTGKCIKCNMCRDICPESVITMEPYPVFNRGCSGCYGCINVCPTFAINSYFVKGGIQYMFNRRGK